LLRDELEAVYSSPAWRLISKYRSWLQTIRIRYPRLYGLYAPFAAQAAVRLTRARRAAPSRSGADDLYQEWIHDNEPSGLQLDLQRELAAGLAYRPLISVVVPVFRIPLAVLEAAVDSVVRQTYDRWELCLAHGDPEDQAARRRLSALSKDDPRIKVQLLPANLGISGNSNAALSLASGEFTALLDHDDTLAPFALFEVVRALNDNPRLDFIYSDTDELEEGGATRIRPFFKPDWSPELMLSVNYVTHLCVIRTEAVRNAGGFRPETDGAQDWDLFLRVTAAGQPVHHIPTVLYHWRQSATSVAGTGLAAKPYAAKAQLRALAGHFAAAGQAVRPEFAGPGRVRLKWLGSEKPSVSVILVSRQLSASAVRSAERILKKADPVPLEIVVPVQEAGLWEGPKLKLVRIDPGLSTADQLNQTAAECSGDVIVFLDEGVVAGVGNWLEELAGPLQNEAVGVVGAKLIDSETRRIRHAGIVFNSDGQLQHLFRGMEEDHWRLPGLDCWYRDLTAVSGACFGIRREVFRQVGGFARFPQYPRWDVDLCLRVRSETGLRVLYNPFARLHQGEPALLETSLRPGEAGAAADYVRALFPAGDPYSSPNLSHRDGSVQFCSPHSPGRQSLLESPMPGPRDVASTLDFATPDLEASRAACACPGNGSVRKITWFLPDFVNPFYGGIHTVLRFADHFLKAHNVQSTFVVLPPAQERLTKDGIATAFKELAEASEIRLLRGHSTLLDLEPSDVAVATFWTTAFHVLRFNRVRRKFYFVQDDETLFYPAGSTSALVEATYRFGFLAICNSAGVRARYIESGGAGEYFDPCVDTSVFHPRERQGGHGHRKTRMLFCYARPSHPRNCFELLAAALRIVKSRLGEQVRIVAAGADWDSKSYGLNGVVETLGVVRYEETAALYRRCDAGVVMMMTCHPSYLPLELMACGALVISNRNPRTSWLLKDRVNCLLAENSATSIADSICEGLLDDDLRNRLTQEALRFVLADYSRWDEQAEKIYRYICRES
jgi:cellulose synthase/poly-beta-1,6-N-acetylglucosamine synthase-like glycosyltransferase/glycosyltransferase involved in cell wall biosynthesis